MKKIVNTIFNSFLNLLSIGPAISFLTWKKNADATLRTKQTKNHISHVCLKCGGELSRGSDSYKSRHIQQVHSKEFGFNEKDALKSIVPADHTLAVKKRKQLEDEKINAKRKKQEHNKVEIPSKHVILFLYWKQTGKIDFSKRE